MSPPQLSPDLSMVLQQGAVPSSFDSFDESTRSTDSTGSVMTDESTSMARSMESSSCSTTVDIESADEKIADPVVSPIRPPVVAAPAMRYTNVKKPVMVTPTKRTRKTKKPKKRSPERKKDPNAPRRPLSAYNLFFRVERERLLEGGFGDGNSNACTITEEDEDRRYDDAVVEQAVNASLVKAQLNLKRSHRKSHGIIAFKELAQAVSERWKKLSPEGREVFEKYAEIERAKYKRQVAAWQSARRETQSPAEAEDPSVYVPNTDDDAVAIEQPSLVSPVVEEPHRPRKITDGSTPCLPAFTSSDNSLNTMMLRGYSTFMEQKRAELELRTSMIDHIEMMMSYSPQVPTTSLGLYGSSAYPYAPSVVSDAAIDSCSVATYQPRPEHGSRDYFSMADSTFQLAQRTLPPQPYSSGACNSSGALAYAPLTTPRMAHGVFVSQVDSSASSQAQVPGHDLYLFPQAGRYDSAMLHGALAPGSTHGPFGHTLAPASAVPSTKPSVRSIPSGCGTVEFDFDAAMDDSDDDEEFREDDSDSIMGLLNCNAEPVSLVSIFDN